MWGQAQHPQCLRPTLHHPWECKAMKGPGRPPAPPLINMQCGGQEQGGGWGLYQVWTVITGEACHHGKGRLSLGSMGHLCFSERLRSAPPQLPNHKGLHSTASGGELECQLQGQERTYTACQEEGWLSQGPIHVFWMFKLSFPTQGLKWEQRQGQAT